MSVVGSDSAAVAWPAVGDGADGGAQILEYVLTLSRTRGRVLGFGLVMERCSVRGQSLEPEL